MKVFCRQKYLKGKGGSQQESQQESQQGAASRFTGVQGAAPRIRPKGHDSGGTRLSHGCPSCVQRSGSTHGLSLLAYRGISTVRGAERAVDVAARVF